MGNVTIYLKVDTATLTGTNCPSQPQVDACCSMEDSSGKKSGSSRPEDFETTVYKDKNVTWEGISNDDGFLVAITGIAYEGGTQMFKNPPPFFGDQTSTSKITQKLQNNSGFEGKTETYTIYFSISNSLKTWGPYTMDPKIKMSTET